MKIAVVTTFHESGLKSYAQNMIDSYLKNWPGEVTLYLYPENCLPVIKNPDRVKVFPLENVEELTIFKKRWKDVPKANGDVSNDPIRSKRKDSGKGFKWDAVRFAHKVYSIFHCAKNTDCDYLIWMDADTICHSPITIDQLEKLIPSDKDLCYLGRKGKYSECGLYAMNLKSERTKLFLEKFQNVYDDAENGIFKMDEWHDSFVFDVVRKPMALKELNWSEHLRDLRPNKNNSVGEGHPLINCEWGAYLDHLKGGRKKLGRSKREDLVVPRTEPYWQQFK